MDSKSNEAVDKDGKKTKMKTSDGCCGRKMNCPCFDGEKKPGNSNLLFYVDEAPPWYMCIALAIQHYLTMIGATVIIATAIMNGMCLDNNLVAKAELLGTVFFVMGIATFIQATFGIRLPIIQGCSAAFIIPIVAMTNLPSMAPCEIVSVMNSTMNSTTNMTNIEPAWKSRSRMISGMIMLASLAQFLIGASGLLTVLLRFIGPLVISPTICLIGLSLFPLAAQRAEGQWWIALMTCFLIFFLTFYMSNFRVPLLWYSREKKWHAVWCFPFRTCPVIIGAGISWALCGIFTVTNVFPPDKNAWGYAARTDVWTSVISDAGWFRWPYPCQWGTPTIIASPILGFIAATICSVMESIGDYHAASKLAGAGSPPAFAVNRGIMIEGLCCFLSALLGAPVATTSYSENVGIIAMTRVGSRRVIQYAAVIMVILGTLTKFTAAVVSIPDPIIGGVFLASFGMLAGVGLSNLQYVNLNSSRNLFIIGSAIFSGLMIPKWVSENPSTINMGSSVLSETVVVLLSINVFVGGFIACILDNTMPGSREDRGLTKWRQHIQTDESGDTIKQDPKQLLSTYDHCLTQRLFSPIKWMGRCPICPKYAEKEIEIELENGNLRRDGTKNEIVTKL